jgi:hypothetical protein
MLAVKGCWVISMEDVRSMHTIKSVVDTVSNFYRLQTRWPIIYWCISTHNDRNVWLKDLLNCRE